MNGERLHRYEKIRSVLGFGLFVVYVGYHLIEQWVAFGGRAAYVARLGVSMGASAVPFWATLLILVPFVVYLLTREDLPPTRQEVDEEPTPLARAVARESRMLDRRTAIVALVFLVVHALSFAIRAWTNDLVGQSTYEILRRDLGHIGVAAGMVIGMTAVCCQTGFATFGVLQAWGLARGPRAVRIAIVSCTILGLVYWIAWLDIIAYFATGAALFG